jgi:hypothetical protein
VMVLCMADTVFAVHLAHGRPTRERVSLIKELSVGAVPGSDGSWAPGSMLRSRELCSQLDYALAVPGSGSAEILEI